MSASVLELKPEGLTAGQCILEDLLKPEELEDGEVNARVEPQAAFVRSQCRIELNAEATVDLAVAMIVFPGDTELDDSFGDGSNSEGLSVLWVLLEQ